MIQSRYRVVDNSSLSFDVLNQEYLDTSNLNVAKRVFRQITKENGPGEIKCVFSIKNLDTGKIGQFEGVKEKLKTPLFAPPLNISYTSIVTRIRS